MKRTIEKSELLLQDINQAANHVANAVYRLGFARHTANVLEREQTVAVCSVLISKLAKISSEIESLERFNKS